MKKDVVAFFDGLVEPVNPGGHGACGWVIWYGKERRVGRLYLGNGIIEVKGREQQMTNNIAEYLALGSTLRDMSNSGVDINHLTILGDSQLVVNQVNKEWQCKKKYLCDLRNECLSILESLDCNWVLRWVPRNLNSVADQLSREAYQMARLEEGSEEWVAV